MCSVECANAAKQSLVENTDPVKQIEQTDLRKQNEELRRQLNNALSHHVMDARFQRFVGDVAERPLVTTPAWAVPNASKGQKSVVPTAFFSDAHFDEVINPAEIGHVNAYNRFIAEERLQYFFKRVAKLGTHYFSGLDYPGIAVPMGGDVFSGNIHEELKQTNESTLCESILHWIDPVKKGLMMLAEVYGKVYIPGVVGNHSRMTHKPIMKGRVRDNIDWLFYRLLQRDLAGDKRFTFAISESADIQYSLFGTRFNLTHGDQFRGGSGIAGLLSPLMIGDARKRKRAQAIRAPFDYLLMGHFHQLMHARGLIVNGCFVSNTLIQTENGIKPIIEINSGDQIISRDGSKQLVTNRFEKESTDGLVALKIRGLPDLLRVTPNHLVWAVKGESKSCTIEPKWRSEIHNVDRPMWIPAEFISPGDFVQIPVHKGNYEPFNTDLAWVFGLYLAEGHSLVAAGASKRHYRIEFTMRLKERSVLERAKDILDKYLRLEGRIWEQPKKTTSHLSYSGQEVAHMFGRLAIGKNLPGEFFDLTPKLAEAIIQGWIDGDGHTRKDGVTCATTVSKNLAYGMFRLALSAGMRPSLAMLRAGGRRKNDAFTIHFNAGQESMEIDGEIFYRVHHRFRSREIVPVFDLEVSGEHTYTAGLVGVHNSLKGYDEYAFMNNFDYEPPQQAFFLTSAERRQIWGFSPIHVVPDNDPYSDGNFAQRKSEAFSL